MPIKAKRDKEFFGVKRLTQREVDILHTLNGWNPNLDGKSTTFTIGRQLDLSQAMVWRYLQGLKDRGLVIKSAKMNIWKLNPDLKNIIANPKLLLGSSVPEKPENETDFSSSNRDSS